MKLDIERMFRRWAEPRAAALRRAVEPWLDRVVAPWLDRVGAAAFDGDRFPVVLAVAAAAAFAAAWLDGHTPVRLLLGVLAGLNLGSVRTIRRTRDDIRRLADRAARLSAGHAEPAEAAAPVGPALRPLAAALDAVRARIDRLAADAQRFAREGGAEIERLSATTQELSAAGEEVAATVQELSADTGAKAEAVQRAAEAAEMVTAAAKEVVAGVSEAVRLNAAIRELAEAQQAAILESSRGVFAFTRDVRTAVEGMRDLSEAAERTAGFVDTIRAITKQTNILALNAAIEAARFGESGHGFTVVSDEIQKLAESAAAAAVEIRSVIRDANRATDRLGTMLSGCVQTGELVAAGVGEAAESFEAVVRQTRSAEEHMFVVQAGAEEIERQIEINTAALEDLSAEVTQIAAATQEMSATAEEMAAGLADLADASARLGRLLVPAATAGDPSDTDSWRNDDVGGEERSREAHHLRANEWVHA